MDQAMLKHEKTASVVVWLARSPGIRTNALPFLASFEHIF
jgi:hypothetical protein